MLVRTRFAKIRVSININKLYKIGGYCWKPLNNVR